jgi:hypothetical protein
VRQYFAAVIYKGNTEHLCHEITDRMTLEIMGYGCAVLVYVVLNRVTNHSNDALEAILRSYVIVFISMIPLVIDFSRCERQKLWNKDISSPPRAAETTALPPATAVGE